MLGQLEIINNTFALFKKELWFNQIQFFMT